MPQFETSMDGKGKAFPSTHWSQLLPTSGHPEHMEAWTRLAERYWKPVYAYVRALHKTAPEDAEDLTQQFFTTLLSKDFLSKLSPDRGSFRGFLKTSLKNFLISSHRSALSRLPRNGFKLFPFHEMDEESQRQSPEASQKSPDEIFDQEWARTVMTRAIAMLKTQVTRDKKAVIFDLLCDTYLDSGGTRSPSDRPSYRELARRYRITEDEADHGLRLARETIRDIVMNLLRDEMGPGEIIENELKLIFQ